MASPQIELWPLDRLSPYERNARTHSAEQVAQIAASIQEFGFTNPILVDGDGVIMAGHGRMAAASSLGLREVPVIVLDHLSPAQRRAYILADNKLALNAGWDEELLKLEIGELLGESIDINLLGWSGTELSDLWGGDAEAEEAVGVMLHLRHGLGEHALRHGEGRVGQGFGQGHARSSGTESGCIFVSMQTNNLSMLLIRF